MNTKNAAILRIEKSSIHDGPGLRTVVFFKGCPLNCKWCSTPESQSFKPEIGYMSSRCTGCRKCITLCKQKALSFVDNKILIDRKKCIGCFICADGCLQNALKRYGESISLKKIVSEICKDEVFFFHSNGGLTLSGGEVLCHADFSAELLEEVKSYGINTAIETSMYSDFSDIEKLLPHLDILYADIKHADTSAHKELVGVDNFIIFENIKKADESNFNFKLYIRIPIIPSLNDSDKNLSDIINFCKNLKKLEYIELLPYHRLGLDTYKYLSRDYSLNDFSTPSTEYMLDRMNFMSSLSDSVKIKYADIFCKQ